MRNLTQTTRESQDKPKTPQSWYGQNSLGDWGNHRVHNSWQFVQSAVFKAGWDYIRCEDLQTKAGLRKVLESAAREANAKLSRPWGNLTAVVDVAFDKLKGRLRYDVFRVINYRNSLLPAEQVAAKKRRAGVISGKRRRAANQTSGRAYAAMLLRLEGRKQREIAELLGVSQQMVSRQLKQVSLEADCSNSEAYEDWLRSNPKALQLLRNFHAKKISPLFTTEHNKDLKHSNKPLQGLIAIALGKPEKKQELGKTERERQIPGGRPPRPPGPDGPAGERKDYQGFEIYRCAGCHASCRRPVGTFITLCDDCGELARLRENPEWIAERKRKFAQFRERLLRSSC